MSYARLLVAALLLGACSGESVLQVDAGSGTAGPGTPLVAGPARYEDRNRNGELDAGDGLIVPFSTDVVLNGAMASSFDLAVSGDSLGAGATLAAGPAPNEITVMIGDGASLKTRQTFDPASVDCDDPLEDDCDDPASGIDVAAVAPGIVNPVDGRPAEASTPIDIVPALVDSGQELGDDRTRSVALGDLDGDGRLDLVEGIFGTANRIWLGEPAPAPAGSYPAPAMQELGAGRTRSVVLVDVDGDADLDVVVGNAAPEPDELWRNDGTAFFTREQVFGACDTWAIAVGDVDGDGDPDLVAADGLQANVVWENVDGLFLFREELADEEVCPGTGTTPPGCPTRDVVLADVNRDGTLDLLEGNWSEQDLLRLNEEGMGFGDPVAVGFERGATSCLVTGDVDRDGDLDLVTGDARSADRVWFNAEGSFADSGQRLGHEATQDVALADLDQDGALDLVVGVRGAGNRCWLNDRRGFFADSRQSSGSGATQALALGDVDRDGDVDVVAGNEGAANRIWLQSLSGTWGTATLVPTGFVTNAGGQVRDAHSVDVDRDGHLDLVLAGLGSSSSVWRNDGSGAFAITQQLAPPVDSRSVAVGDIDADGAPDLIEGRLGVLVEDRLWRNRAGGVFELAEEQPFVNSHDPFEVELVDVDANGALDYVYSDGAVDGTFGIAVWTNENGQFTNTLQDLGGETLALAVGDVDSNGLPDLVEMFDRSAESSGHIWLNGVKGSPPGFFSLGQSFATSTCCNVRAAALGDLDGDGDLDLVSTDRDAAHGDHVWFNDGDGIFTDSEQMLSQGLEFISVVLVDIDGDADLDIVTGSASSLHVEFRNDGAGKFGEGTLIPDGGVYALGLAAGDVDGDGDTDIVAGLRASEGFMVWFNR